MCFCYILQSESRNRFYVGYTCDDLISRITRHNQHNKGFTGRTSDWILVHSEEFGSKPEAMARERQIKNWKSRKAIQELIDPDGN